MILLLALTALLGAQDAQPATDANVVDPLIIEGRRIPTADEITAQLNDLLKREPNRTICLLRKPTGSRIQRFECSTLADWYRFQAAVGYREGPAETIPPTELITAIQEQYARKAAQLRAPQEIKDPRP